MSSNRMSKFEIFIGTWNTEGEVLAVDGAPSNTLTATDIYTWLPGRCFIQHVVDARFGRDVTRSMEVMGYDNKTKKFFAMSFDDRGGRETFRVDLNRKRWIILGEAVRFNGKFEAGDSRLVGLWEMKDKKARWRPWINLVLNRV